MLLECRFVILCVLFVWCFYSPRLLEAAIMSSVEKVTFRLAAPPINAKYAKRK